MINTNKNIGIIVLAAGASSRLGQSKQQLEIYHQPLLKTSVQTACAVCAEHVAVVLGAQHFIHKKLLTDLPVLITINHNWQMGMGNSLKAGLRHVLEADPKLQAVIVMVCDQPLLTPAHLKNMIKRYETTNRKIIASTYNDTVGVPALFDRALFDSMLKLSDEHGAKKIIERYPDITDTIKFPEGAIDIDTPDDLRGFLNRGLFN